jgi:hypothetical protein
MSRRTDRLAAVAVVLASAALAVGLGQWRTDIPNEIPERVGVGETAHPEPGAEVSVTNIQCAGAYEFAGAVYENGPYLAVTVDVRAGEATVIPGVQRLLSGGRTYALVGYSLDSAPAGFAQASTVLFPIAAEDIPGARLQIRFISRLSGVIALLPVVYVDLGLTETSAAELCAAGADTVLKVGIGGERFPLEVAG